MDVNIGSGEEWPSSATGTLPERPRRKREALPKRIAATIGFLADASRRRRAGRLVLSSLVLVLFLVGTFMLTYPFYTEFYAHKKQGDLARGWKQNDPKTVETYKEKKVAVGDALTRLIIPKLNIDVIVVEGTTGNALRAGAGHYKDTALPGDPGNVAIAGHRTGFGEPFRHLERLTKGDEVALITPIGRFTYQVIGTFDAHPNPWITYPRDWSVIQPTALPSLTLTTCDPPHTSLNRMIVRLTLVKSEIST